MAVSVSLCMTFRRLVTVTMAALLLLVAVVCEGADATTGHLQRRLKSSQPAGVVFDLVFADLYAKEIAADIPSVQQLAMALARQSGRADLIALCKAAQSGWVSLQIPRSSKDVRDFQQICRSYELALDWPVLTADQALDRLAKCRDDLGALGAELASTAVTLDIADVNLSRLSRHRTATAGYTEALGVLNRYEMNLALADVYRRFASIYRMQGRLDTTEAAFIEAGDRFKAGGRPESASECFFDAADCLVESGETRLASSRSKEALSLARKSYALGGRPEALLNALDRAAHILERAGNREGALVLRKEAAGLSPKASDPRPRVSALAACADALEHSGDRAEADRVRSERDRLLISATAKQQSIAKSLALAKTLDSARMADCHSLLGWIHRQRKSTAEAASYFESASGYYEAAGDYSNALACLISRRECLQSPPSDLIAEKAEQWSEWETACSELKQLAEAQGLDEAAAVRYYERAVSAARRATPRRLQAILAAYGRFLLDRDPREADRRLAEAVEIARDTWTRLDEISDLYLTAVRAAPDRTLSLMEDWAHEVLSASDVEAAGHSEQPSASVAEAMSVLRQAELEAGRNAQADDFDRRLSALLTGDPHGAQTGLQPARLIAAGRAAVLSWLTTGLSSGSGRSEARRIVQQVDALPESTVYVHYLVNHESFYALAARDSSDIRLYGLGERERLYDELERFRQAVLDAQGVVTSGLPLRLRDNPLTAGSDPMLRSLISLHELLIEPVLSPEDAGSNLLVGLPDVMGCLPVHAFISGKTSRYLIDDRAVSYAGGRTVATNASRPWGASASPVILAADREIAPSVEDEIAGIRAALPSASLLRSREIAESFQQVVRDARCVHIAAHCSASENSRIDFGGDPPCSVSLGDIYGIRAPGLDLVVLSCCESAGGMRSRVGTQASLVGAFEFAGARSIAASLWEVSDKASAAFARPFYKALAEGKTKAEAVRLAQKSMAASQALSHPFYWAAFALFGDPS